MKKKKGLIFPKSSFKEARSGNSDGAGFVVFDWDRKKEKWEVIDLDLFKASKEKKYYYDYGYGKTWDYEDWGSYYTKQKKSEPKTIKGEINKKAEQLRLTAGQEDYEICETGKTKYTVGNDFNEEEEKEWLKSQLPKADFLKMYPEEADDYDFEKFEIAEVEEDEDDNETYEDHTAKASIGFTTKTEDKDDAVETIFERQKKMKSGQMMIAHFRLSTSGHTHENTQPILNGDYIVIHNGVFGYHSEPAGYSDTRYFSEKLKNESKKYETISPKTEQKIIEKLLDKAGGYYSIFIYSFRTGQIYYYKSSYASFSWAYNGLMGATRSERFPIRHYSAQAKEVIRL